MGTTANLGLPYPEASDPPAGHTQIQALADAVDTFLDGMLDDTQFQFVAGSGSVPVNPNNDYQAKGRILFGRAFKSGAVPVVMWSLVDNGYPVQTTINNIDHLGFDVTITVLDVGRPPGGTLPSARQITYLAVGTQP